MDLSRFTKLFNQGYFLSEFEPKILKSLLKSTEDEADINEALSAGKSQLIKDQLHEKLKELNQPEKDDLDRGFEPKI